MKKSLSSLYFQLPTEQPNPATRNIDRLGILRAVELIQKENQRVPVAVLRESPAISRAVKVLVQVFKNGGRLYFVGAGTSGRLGVVEAAECPPTFGTAPQAVQAVMAGGRASVFQSREGAEDNEEAGKKEVRRRVRRGDAVAGIAASGVTPFVLGALKEAKRRGCRTILVTSNHKPVPGAAEIVICPRVGPEVLSGSTRMKAGTAAKLVLNTLTTVAMIQLGKAYQNWMVDLKPTSQKLKFRAVRLISRLGRVSPGRAERFLGFAHGNTKVAILMAHKGLSYPKAVRALNLADGFLRKVFE
ncbi:MAG: N-acetylmuramic acid 6-phosphate etherase [Elusimicrobia bacterium]|nr:N-acetylmuramic acid 6-phosphate etherase [Elusimicrobiota bacterium]